ncbi:hypothetical protein [Mycobacterium angelicum]|uniref:Uncharacterized protein n=1 Tax=Mycobacterium angelicum TaxID=470074 RepID=A0A1X0A5L3_MYCAN|nr:hypothetical protein [Mycobacterium angelicum]MCV7197126.1 hypothetical protein [Mycobacterium angelicum]ORA25360.1 hypothetical protein BST12_03505 [Mycobacterium angelicum]
MECGFDSLSAVADAILYEGYLLYPYRRSSPKNRVRWQFGVLAPRPWLSPDADADTGVSGSADGWYQRSECLLEAPHSACIRVRLRFLHVHHRSVQRACADGEFEPVDQLDDGERRHLTFDDAVPREHEVVATIADLVDSSLVVDVRVPGAQTIEPLPQGAGRIIRTSQAISATIRLSISTAQAPFPLRTLYVTTENSDATTVSGVARRDALSASLVATHTLIGLDDGAFLSLLDPPAWATPAAKACRNIHTFPVLAGEPGRHDVMLSSPILLYDYPAVSPESPGDLFDAGEIDEILSLRTGTLTEQEKQEARATDPRAAAIIDRVDQMPREVMDRLHGAVRAMRPYRPAGPDVVTVDGVDIRAGSRVRLQPRRRGTDAHDIFLDGRTAVVEAVLLDTEDVWRIAVTLDDDEGADLNRWYGRFYYFGADEVSPLEAEVTVQQQESL